MKGALGRGGGHGAGYGTAGVGALEMPVLHWTQIGVGLFVGLGLGYVFFASK